MKELARYNRSKRQEEKDPIPLKALHGWLRRERERERSYCFDGSPLETILSRQRIEALPKRQRDPRF